MEIGADAVAFSEVSGLSIGYNTTTYKESPTASSAGPRMFHMPSQPTNTTLTLKKGVVRKASVGGPLQLDQQHPDQPGREEGHLRPAVDETGAPVISWKVVNAFPTKLDAPSFTADSNDVAVESMELLADGAFIEEA